MSEPPDETQVIPVTRHPTFFDQLADEFSDLIRRRRYHEPQSPASTAITTFPAVTVTTTPAPEEDIMALIATLETDAEALRAKVEEFVKSKLPAATDDLKRLEAIAGNPVVLSLLNAVHVPTEALAMAVKVIDGLEDLYKPETAVAAPAAPAVPEVPAAPAEPAPAA